MQDLLAADEAMGHACGEGVTDLNAAEIAQTCKVAQRIVTRGHSFLLDAAAAADKCGVATHEGASSTQSWLASSTGVSERDAAKDLKLAKDLQSAAPQTRAAMAEPGMSKDKARLIAGAMCKLPRDLSDEDRQRVEADLIEKAKQISVEDLRRAARRAVEVLDPARADLLEGEQLSKEEREGFRKAKFWMAPEDEHGMVEGGFNIPVLQAQILRSGLESLTSPRHGQFVDADETSATYPQKLGRAFTEILEHLPTNCFANHGGVAATVVVNLDYDQLLTDIGAATLSNGTRISAGAARRIACNAGIIPQILGSRSLPLDLGAEPRLFSKSQRIALAHRDGGCAFPDCQAPPGWCDAHHISQWSTGGPTDLANGVLLCGRHHRMIHDTTWEIRVGADHNPEFIPPEHIDHHQKPLRNNRWKATRKQAA